MPFHPPRGGRNARHLARLRRLEESESQGFSPSIHELDSTLHDANLHLRALLDLTHHESFSPPPPPPPRQPPPPPRSLSPPMRTHDTSDGSRRAKRRKLGPGRNESPAQKRISYGYIGQVKPADLRMEIVSCDGGMFEAGSSYAAENILRDDLTVYCTKEGQCNILLKLQGDMAFSLEELIIKSPTQGHYSAPCDSPQTNCITVANRIRVREGMVFVSMEKDELLERTTQYQIQYGPMRSPHLLRRASQTTPACPTRSNWEEYENLWTTAALFPPARGSARARRLNCLFDEEPCGRVAQMPREFLSHRSMLGVTTECDYDSDDPMPGNSRYVSRPLESGDESESSEDPLSLSEEERPSRQGKRRREDEGAGEAEGEEAEAEAEAEAESSRGCEDRRGRERLLAPHARFNIYKGMSRCSIKFDPPVSGRFILLKMFSSHNDPSSNIDIQAVVARGYVGPRYFPAIEPR